MNKILMAMMLLPMFCGVAAANGVGNFCPGWPWQASTCVIDAPVYVNVYWDQTWDQDVQALGSTGLLRARIDAATEALVRSGYFSQLAQYKVWSVSMGPSITPACQGAPATMDLVVANNDNLLNNLMDCILAAYPSLKNKNTILNIFVPPGVATGKWGLGADHKNLRGIALCLLPTNQGDSAPKDFSRLLEMASHEMVEAATDPNPDSPTGYRNKDIGSIAGEEIADLCNAAVPFLGIGDGSALFGVTQYWSDNANSCVTPFPTLTPPTISPMSIVCGTGRNMNITLTGTFGPTPWDLVANPVNGQTIYVQAAINNTWNSGSLLNIPPSTPPITVGFGFVSWRQGSPDSIVLNGFDSHYGSSGQIVKPGDQIQVSVYSPLNGQSNSTIVTAPEPASIWLGYQAMQANSESSVSLTGQVLDPSKLPNCGIGGTQVTLDVSAGSRSAGTIESPVTTADDGSFAAPYTAPAVAGNVTLTAKASPASTTGSISVLPVLTSLSAMVGTVTGGQQITLTGFGFDNSTTVSFSGIGQNGNPVSSNKMITSVSLDHHTVTLTTPASPLPGDGIGYVMVYATVNGVSGGPLQYLFIVPGEPFGTIQENICQTHAPYHVTVTAYNADGSVDPVMIDLSSTAPIFGNNLFKETVQSGVPFLISGSGPYVFTAKNDANSLSTVITFTCNLIPPGPGMLPVNFIPGPNCDGDCGGPPGNSSIWTWGEASELSSLVISGIPASEVQQIYKVTGVSGATLARLVNVNSSVIAAGTPAVNAIFIGQPVSIELARQSNAASIKHSALLSFAVPTSVDRNYQIVRYERRGTEFVWIAVPRTTILNRGSLIQAHITETGLYALVSTGAQ